MRKNKRLVALVLVSLMGVSLIGCGSGSKPKPDISNIKKIKRMAETSASVDKDLGETEKREIHEESHEDRYETSEDSGSDIADIFKNIDSETKSNETETETRSSETVEESKSADDINYEGIYDCWYDIQDLVQPNMVSNMLLLIGEENYYGDFKLPIDTETALQMYDLCDELLVRYEDIQYINGCTLKMKNIEGNKFETIIDSIQSYQLKPDESIYVNISVEDDGAVNRYGSKSARYTNVSGGVNMYELYSGDTEDKDAYTRIFEQDVYEFQNAIEGSLSSSRYPLYDSSSYVNEYSTDMIYARLSSDRDSALFVVRDKIIDKDLIVMVIDNRPRYIVSQDTYDGTDDLEHVKTCISYIDDKTTPGYYNGLKAFLSNNMEINNKISDEILEDFDTNGDAKAKEAVDWNELKSTWLEYIDIRNNEG